jgi:hypothetical protein
MSQQILIGILRAASLSCNTRTVNSNALIGSNVGTELSLPTQQQVCVAVWLSSAFPSFLKQKYLSQLSRYLSLPFTYLYLLLLCVYMSFCQPILSVSLYIIYVFCLSIYLSSLYIIHVYLLIYLASHTVCLSLSVLVSLCPPTYCLQSS